MANLMSRKAALDWINNHKGVEFTVKFKKADGSIREMRCKAGYDDGTLVKNPNNRGVDFAAKGLVGVYDMDKQQYRSFRQDSLQAYQDRRDMVRNGRNPRRQTVMIFVFGQLIILVDLTTEAVTFVPLSNKPYQLSIADVLDIGEKIINGDNLHGLESC